jgi:hypothetical protein
MCFIYVLLVHVDEFDIEDDVEIDNWDCDRIELFVKSETGIFLILKNNNRLARFCVSLNVTNVHVLWSSITDHGLSTCKILFAFKYSFRLICQIHDAL